MVSSGYTRVIRVNTLTREIPNRKMPKQIIVVGIPREYLSIVY